MQVGISTASFFNRLEVEDALVDLSSHGVRLCEVFLDTYSEYEPSYIDLLARRLAGRSLSVYSVHPMGTQFEPQLFSIQERQRNDALKLYEKVLHAGRRLGASVYVMHGPVRVSAPSHSMLGARVVPVLTDLSAMAREFGMQLALENVSWCLFSAPSIGVELLNRLGSGALKFTLDVKQAVRSGYTPFDYIDAVGSESVNLHLCDADLLAGGDYRLRMPGEGGVDFAGIRDALANCGYRGPAFVEVYSNMYDSMPELYESYARMQRIFS